MEQCSESGSLLALIFNIQLLFGTMKIVMFTLILCLVIGFLVMKKM
jgi:hypothetical protein